MKKKLLITFSVTFVTVGGTAFLLRAIYNDMKNFPKEVYYSSTPNANSGKHTNSISNPPDIEYVDMTAEVYSDDYSVSLFDHKSNNQYVYPDLPELSYDAYGNTVVQKQGKSSRGGTNSLPIGTRASGKSSLRAGGSSGLMKTSGNNAKGEQLNNKPENSSPADNDDEDIFYVRVGEGFWVLMFFLAAYVVWKIKKKTHTR